MLNNFDRVENFIKFCRIILVKT